MWGFGAEYTQEDLQAVYRISREAGITFFDTAEVYGGGASETILGGLAYQHSLRSGSAIIATKFAPWHRRHWTARSVGKALGASLVRLGVQQVDLYQVHFWPSRLIRLGSLMNAMADQVEAGKARSWSKQFLGKPDVQRLQYIGPAGIPLASNQVHYNLLHREPERSGHLGSCRELGVQLIAYSPLEQGILTGKYHAGSDAKRKTDRYLPAFRPTSFCPDLIDASAPLISRLRQIGEVHGGKSPAQVALNWLMRRGTLPIPGAKTAAQAAANAGALGWELTEEEVEELNDLRG